MQRELRFRVWSNEKCFEHEEENIIEIKGCYISTDRLRIDLAGNIYDSHREDVTIEQYIGISDEEGVPIYENDIVRGEFLDLVGLSFEYTSIQGKVVFYNNCWQLQIPSIPESYYNIHTLEKLKIIGNIHE